LPYLPAFLDCSLSGLNLLPSTLAGAEGFEPPSSVLETDSLTVELTPLKTVPSCQFSVKPNHWQLATGHWQLTISLPCAACACGTGGRTSSVPNGPVSFCGSWSLNSSALCTRHTAT